MSICCHIPVYFKWHHNETHTNKIACTGNIVTASCNHSHSWIIHTCVYDYNPRPSEALHSRIEVYAAYTKNHNLYDTSYDIRTDHLGTKTTFALRIRPCFAVFFSGWIQGSVTNIPQKYFTGAGKIIAEHNEVIKFSAYTRVSLIPSYENTLLSQIPCKMLMYTYEK